VRVPTRVDPGEVTGLLERARAGDGVALDRLLPLIYDELKAVARSFMRGERPGHTLQTTALVNEAYLRLVDVRRVDWRGRAHFVALAARMMRRTLIDHARRRLAAKRGGGWVRVSLDEKQIALLSNDQAERLLVVEAALRRLQELDPRQAEVVELRFFGGLSVAETAAALGISEKTVKRDWAVARAWLQAQVRSGSAGRAGEPA
jgi:RNA polymerase sigma factor (TIGR02999 family)